MEKKGLSSTIRLNRELHRQGSSMPTQVSSSMRARRLHCRKALATRRPSTHGVIVRKAGDNVANLLSVARLSFHGSHNNGSGSIIGSYIYASTRAAPQEKRGW